MERKPEARTQTGHECEITIDTGGTFTDGVLVDEQRKISTAKCSTNVADPAACIMECIALLAQERRLTLQELLARTSTMVIGTTLACNCILNEKGAKCCLIHTQGFRDMPELGRRIPKADVYDQRVPPPRVLIPRYLRFGVEERIRYDGEVITPLNEDEVAESVKRAKEQNVEVPIVCFLHSYSNPAHEEKAAKIIKTNYPNVVLSSHILRRRVEWDRLTTATLAGYVKPIISHFVNGLQKSMGRAGFKQDLLFITCAGGVANSEICIDNPALLIESGPAGGAIAGRFLAELGGFENAIACDMGGTSFDVCMLPKRMIPTTNEMQIGDYRNACESIDIASIGAGGGSIAWIDERGILRVGPSSAGADPGPACYVKGGQDPTVTDANVILGYIPTDYFLGGTIALDASVAAKVIEERIAKPLGIDRIEAAYAISSVVEAHMAERIFLTAVEGGFDPRDFVLIAAGGAGPVHGINMAAKLGIKQVYVPKLAAQYSAMGMMRADYRYTRERFFYHREDEVDIEELKGLYASLLEEGTNSLRRQGLIETRMRFIRGAEIQYYGQIHTVDVSLPETKMDEPFIKETLKALIDAFHEKHKALYGWSNPTMPVTIGTLKVQSIGTRTSFEVIKQPLFGEDATGALKRKRRVYFKKLEKFVETQCYDGDRLRPGNVVIGPAIIEETTTTVVVPPGAKLTVDDYGNYKGEIK